MKLVSFSVRNFRSITDAYKVRLEDLTILVGPNNEGKSNVLQAIGTSLRLLTGSVLHSGRLMRVGRRSRYEERLEYVWNRDFPMALQDSMPEGKSEFVLEFLLDDEEKDIFSKKILKNLASNLKIKLSLGREGFAQLEVVIQGPAKKEFARRLREICGFIDSKVDFQYIPALRPAEMTTGVIEEMLGRELGALEDDPSYVALLSKLSEAQQPTLDRIGRELTKTVSGFIPEVKTVKVRQEELRRAVRSSCRVLIDDGTMTDLELKGDGVKSLTAISLLHRVRERGVGGKRLILAVEEPESHLHPRAIHQLKDVLHDISESNQVIVTTHSPVLVDRVNVRNNIVVRRGKAVAAKTLKDVRDLLGVEISDNLAGAYLVLLVEGEKDVVILKAWIGEGSSKLRSAMSSGLLAIEALHGASKLKYKAGLYRNLLCNIHAFLDNDEEGRKAIAAAKEVGLLKDAEYVQTTCAGMKNSEIEDLVRAEVYKSAVESAFGVILREKNLRNAKKSWSDRITECFVSSGKPWSEKTEAKAKEIVAKAVTEHRLSSLNSARRGPFDMLINQLERRIERA